jgi:hypothetical protein
MSHPSGGESASTRTDPVKLLRCEEGQSFILRFLTEKYGGMFTHWTGTRSVRCWSSGCEPCRKRNRQIWKGYIGVEEWIASTRSWKPHVLEISEHLELRLRGRNLKGEVFKVSRAKKASGTKKPTAVEGEYLRTMSDIVLRDDVLVSVILQWVYGPGEYPLDEDNPLPAKLFLDHKRDEPPPADAAQAESRAGQGSNGQGSNGQGSNGQAEQQSYGHSNGRHP